jgi:hypothetical protein
MHTHNLLHDRADRSTIRPEELPWLDEFLVEQSTLQRALRDQLLAANTIAPKYLDSKALHSNFQLLQACDNLSLLSCVDFAGYATLLHPLPLNDGGACEVEVRRIAERTFRLTPYPFDSPELTFNLKARFIEGKQFASSDELAAVFIAAPFADLEVKVTA